MTDSIAVQTLLSICLGLGLSAATGLRIFVPLLAVSLAARSGWLQLGEEFIWLQSSPILITLAVATVAEIVAYYVPWLDNLLDSIATPAAVLAGIVITASVITGIDPALKWTLAIIAGGGVAGAVQTATVGGRQLSSFTTAGLANPVLATLELGGSLVLSVLSLLLPLIAGLTALALVVMAIKRLRRRKFAP